MLFTSVADLEATWSTSSSHGFPHSVVSVFLIKQLLLPVLSHAPFSYRAGTPEAAKVQRVKPRMDNVVDILEPVSGACA